MKRNDEEFEIQSAAVEHAERRWVICRTNLIAIPNGEERPRRLVWSKKKQKYIYICPAGQRAKKLGQKAGVWDLFLAVSKFEERKKLRDRRFSGLWILDAKPEDDEMYCELIPGLWMEVKNPKYRNKKRGGLTPEQEAFGREMARQGYATSLCYTTQEILDTIEAYLRGANQ